MISTTPAIWEEVIVDIEASDHDDRAAGEARARIALGFIAHWTP